MFHVVPSCFRALTGTGALRISLKQQLFRHHLFESFTVN